MTDPPIIAAFLAGVAHTSEGNNGEWPEDSELDAEAFRARWMRQAQEYAESIGESDENFARAERAEARVKELEAELADEKEARLEERIAAAELSKRMAG